ncbi:hypothetical protein F4678DRAFT_459078 [Xylaria arbuscula]|nr:hypothetical protein F4678DRAFT_459078 [Xylaria arbuscula]
MSSTERISTSNESRSTLPNSFVNASRTISVASSAVKNLEESPSIQNLIDKISGDLDNSSRTADLLRDCYKSIDRRKYEKSEWTPEIVEAHAEYKRLGRVYGKSHRVFIVCKGKTTGGNTASPEQYIDLAKLAIKWGQDCVLYITLFYPLFSLGTSDTDTHKLTITYSLLQGG